MPDTPDVLKTLYEAADRHFLHDLNIFWQRTSVLSAVQAGLLVAFGALIENQVVNIFLWILGAVALLQALLWLWIAASTQYRIWRWRECLLDVAKRYDTTVRLNDTAEAGGPRWYRSPSRLGVGIPMIFAGGWICALVWALASR